MFLEGNPAPLEIRLIVAGVSIAMILFSRWFQNKFKIDRQAQMELQNRNQDLQERLKAARAEGNQAEFMELNAELLAIMREMTKKQMIPMLIRSMVWLGIWFLLNFIFVQSMGYDVFIFPFLLGDGLFSLYLFVSICFAVVSIVWKMLKKKLNIGKPEEEIVYDHIGGLNGNLKIVQEKEQSPQSDYSMYSSTTSNSDSDTSLDPTKSISSNPKSWKDRLDS